MQWKRRLAAIILAGLIPASTAGPLTAPAPDRKPENAEGEPARLFADPLWMSDAELEHLAESNLENLGSLSVGNVSGGLLINAVPIPADPRWEIIDPNESWATEETVRFIDTAVSRVHAVYPESPPLYIGDISRREGGRLNRHASHQSGRDVDLGFYYKPGRGWWHAPGSSRNLDVPRNWALVRALLTCTDLECILLDTRIQRLLYRYAVSIGEDEKWLKRVMQYPTGRSKAPIRHVSGHLTHYHVRFFNRRAQALARRVYPLLLRSERIRPPHFVLFHKVRGGETLGHLAERYKTSVRAIRAANGLRGNLIRAGRTYRIPGRGIDAPPEEPLVIPPRILPPLTPEILRAAPWPVAGPALTPHI